MTTTTRVYLLRHAESADPTVFHGAESDVDLSPRGYLQAAAIAEYLAARRPDLVVSSAMRRARMTAAPIAAACRVPHELEPQLHERRVGALSGTSFTSTEGLWPATLARWMNGETHFAPDGAESFDDIRARVLPAWQRITEANVGRTLVVVAHGIVCKVLLLTLLPGGTAADWVRLGPIRNVAVNELRSDGVGWSAERIGDLPALLHERGLV